MICFSCIHTHPRAHFSYWIFVEHNFSYLFLDHFGWDLFSLFSINDVFISRSYDNMYSRNGFRLLHGICCRILRKVSGFCILHTPFEYDWNWTGTPQSLTTNNKKVLPSLVRQAENWLRTWWEWLWGEDFYNQYL